MRRDRDRVEGVVRGAGVPSPALHVDEERVGRRGQRSALRRDLPGRIDRGDVDGECGRGSALAVQETLLDHDFRAEVPFLAGLEHQQHAAVQAVSVPRDELRRRGEHGHVRVVAARVHRVGDLRGEVQASVLGHRQRVHVAAQQDGRSLLRPVERRHHRRRPLPRRDLVAEPVERLQDLLLCLRKLQPDLRLEMDAAAKLDGLLQQLAGLVEQARQRGVSHRGSSSLPSAPTSSRRRAPRAPPDRVR